MDIIISTLSNLIVFNIVSNKWYVVRKNDGPYYGIAEYKNNIILGKRNGIDPIKSHASFLVCDYKFNLIEEIKPKLPIRDLHGIIVVKDELWVTSTFDNLIGIYSFKTKQWKCWKPSEEQNKFEKVTDELVDDILNNTTKGNKHFNTIGFNKSYLNLVAHNWGQSEVFYYDIKNLDFLKKINLGQKSHNLWYNDDELFTLSSDTGEIVSTKNFSLLIKDYPRGFTKANERLYIGLSTKNSLPGTKRDRYTSSFYIVSFDDNYQDRKNFFFKNLGDVNDIFFSEKLQYMQRLDKKDEK